MAMTISLYTMGVWFVWGVIMGFGWAIGQWLWQKIVNALNAN
jgi:hypothetical protein